ncbi:MAG: hypothetical protein JXA21_00995 [Anaerolineae bacterium]|nr:hypothetical protein [Anaerolineae bacterium]
MKTIRTIVSIALVIGLIPAPTKFHPHPHLFWVACSLVGLTAGVHFLVIEANRMTAARLLMAPVLLIICSFLAANLIGVVSFARHLKEAVSASSQQRREDKG